jgi:hypothetical protein
MPTTGNTQAGTSGPPSATGSPGDGHRHLGHRRRPHSGTAPHAPSDLGALAREAVISFLRDASDATAEREAARAGVPATGTSKADGAPAAAPGPEAASRDAIFAALPPTASPPTASPPTASPVAPSPVAAGSVAWRAAAISVAALDRIEAAAAKVEADIAIAVRAYADLQAGAGLAAEAAVQAAQSAMASAGVAMAAERQVKISLRQVRQYVVVTTVLLAITIIVLAFATSPVI